MLTLTHIVDERFTAYNTTIQSLEKADEVIPEDKIQIEFSDKTLVCDIEFLKEMDLFTKLLATGMRETREKRIQFKRCDSSLFQAAVDISLHNRFFYDNFHENSYLKNLDLYEEITAVIDFLGVGKRDRKCEEAILKLLQRQLRSMKLETAQAILHAYQKQPKTQEKSSTVQEVPFLVRAAHDIYIKSIYFEDEQAAKEHFEAMYELEKERITTEMLLQAQEDVLAQNNAPQPRIMVEAHIKSMQTYLNELNKQWKEFSAFDAPDQMTIQMHRNALRWEFSDNVTVRSKVLESKAVVEQYKSHLLQVLKKSDADISRKDLLEYLVGPKEFLLARYGLNFGESKDEKSPFTRPSLSINFRYNLYNKGPWDLEEEIRTDLTPYVSLPERFIKQKEITMKLSDEQIAMRKDLLHIFKTWNDQTPSIQDKAINKVLSFNGWNCYQISSEHILFKQNTFREEEIQGLLGLNGKLIETRLDLQTFHLIIDPKDGTTGHDFVTTKRFLESPVAPPPPSIQNNHYRCGEEAGMRK